MNKALEIIKAWKNYVQPTDLVKEIAEERLKVCNVCPFKEKNFLLGFDYCGLCKCPLEGKTHSPINSCDKNKWVR